MRSNICVTNSLALAAGALLAGAGCAHNYWAEDSPAAKSDWNSATMADVYARMTPSAARVRGWPEMKPGVESGTVRHTPLYFEDPFEDKGSGHDGSDKYRIGWEDYVAMPYGLARHMLNWFGLPVSLVVTPPWMAMESDGRLSRQILGYDHDAIGGGVESKSPSAPAEPDVEPAPAASDAPAAGQSASQSGGE